MLGFKEYIKKMGGSTKSPPRVSLSEVLWSWASAFIGISAVAYLNKYLVSRTDLMMIIGSFGASAVLVYGAIKSPLAQPRNLVGGHVLSGFVGVFSWQVLHFCPWVAAAFAVATAIGLMHLTKTLHPPGGATALIAVIGSERIHELGYLYPIIPAGAGAMVMLAVAVIVNNIPKTRRYPEFWL